MPTLTQLVGATPQTDPQWDGSDIWPLISGRECKAEDRSFYWNFNGGAQLGLRRGEWKLIVRKNVAQAGTELFNIAEDPYETTDRSFEDSEIVKELTTLMTEERFKDDISKRKDIDSQIRA
jgi:arylsulfatase A-like enzyme